MVLVLILTWILKGLGVHDAVLLWHWFGSHVLATVLMVLFLA